jgi:EF-hand domain-containing family member B
MSTVLGRSENSQHKRQDPIPNIRSAGHQIPGVELESADYSIRQDVHLAGVVPGTPEHLKKYRKSHVNQPGMIQKHYGMANDPARFPESYSYGKGTHGSEPFGQIIKANNLEGMQDKFNDIKESQYASHAKEPLGKAFERGYNWPQQAQDPNHKFGLPSTGLENAKDMIYPATGSHTDGQDVIEMYKKTHGNFAPGEQKNRNYDWKFDA